MDLTDRQTLLAVGTAILMLLGIAFVFMQSTTMTVVGILLVIGSALAFMVTAKNLVVRTDKDAR